ncbi:MAG: subclass B3 metallo-beta-lactamase [Acidobacteriaceae bacterium]|nr:subclass B3 metallo-beta-lactamase [Acidobacteriaceae bacterium]MBV9763946.1 subclass B3 metallo-beta-lactamase [Acidobacteriaceae bacterium]
MRPRSLTILVAFLATGLNAIAQMNPEERAAWNKPVKPFRIIGNIYYVGAEGVSAFLISTPSGAILLDGGFPETAPLIRQSVSELGFHLDDIKFLLNSHAHYDHCGGLTELKRRSGAKMIASEGDSTYSNGGWTLNCFDKTRPFPPVRVDRIIRDKETVELGGAILTAHLTPGHTKGCTTWTMQATDSGKAYQVVFYCSTTVAGNRLIDNRAYPSIVSDYEQSFAKLQNLPCDVFLGPHGSFFHLDEKMAALQSGRQDAFVDRDEMRKFVDQSERDFHEELTKQERALKGSGIN